QADAFRPAGKSAVTCRQLHHASGHDLLSSFRWGPPTCQNQVRGYVVGIATFEPRHGELGLGKSRSVE
ncbi:hypothetical protein, partial [Bradyrhizobium sp. SZCCHNS1054]|uniref:hypothetical protein n=1 Tax=Bradyrhizobium sp. SZCCHNS1054 TaxID=3057301 RepID=UPI002916FA7E